VPQRAVWIVTVLVMNLSNEQLQEKKQHLESELRKLQTDLVDILNQNDVLTLQNKEKDETIAMKEKKLTETKDKNSLDLEQLKTVSDFLSFF
jgi:ABC-type transport system involved in cytochrome bd biosynthesis fused ATPase/permease subunit